ncbi:hypothetical protein ACOALA_10240 [Alicyclobacillus acidoterrestris]|uniref:hypothetical protein n=1 Tax=Alicyclobacillus acidoterrestris TaxID=1450 RepID=UPI003F53187A
MYDSIFQMRDQLVRGQSQDGRSSNVEKFSKAYDKYQKDLASVGVKPYKEQLYRRPYKA